MTLLRTTVTKRLFALLASTSLIMTMGACSSANETQSHETDSPSTATATDAGNVVIFTPSDGITISQQTPLSKWEKLVPEIVSSLKDNDVKGANITVKAAPSLDKQSQSVQDYVVNHVNSTSDDADSSDKTTLVVAPVADTTESDRQYGETMCRTPSHGMGAPPTKTPRTTPNPRNVWFPHCSSLKTRA